ncbi:glycosyltransferase [Limosilactobacillus vaginalis]
MEKIVSNFTDLFICVSKYDEAIGRRENVLGPNDNVIVIHNGTTEPKREGIRRPIISPIQLVMVARFSKQKDQETLIRAVKELPSDKYQLTFVGAGETLQQNQRLVSKFNLESNVKFIGFREDINKVLEKKDIFVLSTHYEGLPISIIEAMAYGLPVLATDVGGNSEMVKNNINGFLFSSKNELVRKLRQLIDNPYLIKKMGYQSHVIFKYEYSLSTCLDSVNDAYLRLVNNQI